MDNTTRLQYLEAMGIASWQPRQGTGGQDAGEQMTEALELSTPPETESVPPLPEASLQAVETEKVPAQRNEPPVVEVIAPIQETVVQAIPKSVSVARHDNWETLEREVSQCQKCALCQTRTQTVFGIGNRNADWLFVGEAPGENEDLQGKPFVGNAGLLLTEMIRALGLERDEVFIANILKCRPPNNRDPKMDEIAACHDYLMRQKALISPKIMVAVGRIAAQQLLKTNLTLGKLRGTVHKIDNTPLIVVYHPAYLLRTLSQKRAAWQDLQLALKTYRQL